MKKSRGRNVAFANLPLLLLIVELHFVIFLYIVYLAKPLKLIKSNAAQFGNIHDLGSAWVADIGCLFGEKNP